MSYEVVLKKKLLNLIKEKRTITSICEEYKVSRGTLYNWIEKEKSGDLEAKMTGPKGPRVNNNEIINYIYNNRLASTTDIVEKFGISKALLSLILKRNNIKMASTYIFPNESRSN